MVAQQRFEILLAPLGEKESIDFRPELLECKVRRREKSAACMRCVAQRLVQASLFEAEEKGGKVAGEEGEDFQGWRGRHEDRLESVDYAVCGGDVDSGEASVEV